MDQQPSAASDLATGKQPKLPGIASEIDMGTLIEEWKLAKYPVELTTRDFRYLDDLVDGVPLIKDPEAPFVGDTTLPGLVRSIPRQSLQQLPVFSVAVNGTKNSIAAAICTFLLRKFAFNEDTFGKGLLSTLQIGGEQALTHGYAPFMVATGSMYRDFGTTLRLLHFMDTAPEPGTNDANEAGYHYVVAHLTPSRVKKIMKAAKGNPDTLWDVNMLQRVLDSAPKPKQYSLYEGSVDRQQQPMEQASPVYEFVTRYETGPGGVFVTFCPDVDEAPLRVIESKSKYGYPRVLYLVIDPHANNPFGISRVRLASPNQNLMNIYYGNIASTLLLNSKPPIFKRGRFLKPVALQQGAVWESQDPNSSVDVKAMDGTAIQSFVEMAKQFATQIQNIMGGSTAGASGTEQFSKTAPGVEQAGQVMDINTKQITNILQNFLRQYALLALDTLLSEQTGEDDLIVDDDTKNAINDMAMATYQPNPDPNQPAIRPDNGPIGGDNVYKMIWKEFYAGIKDWTVTVDVSLTPDEMKKEKRQDLQDMLVVLAQNAQELGPEAVEKVKEITDMLLQDAAPAVGTLALNGDSGGQGGPPPPHVNIAVKADPAATQSAEKSAGLIGQ